MERSVEGWKKRVSELDGFTNNGDIRFASKVWFSALGINMGVGSEERVEGTGLVPSGKKLLRRVTEETADISCEID